MNKSLYALKEGVSVFTNKAITRNAAALSFYLTLSAFPFLICVSAILGTMNIQETDAFAILSEAIPEAAYTVLYDYFQYISAMRTELVLTVGVTALLTSSSAAFRTFSEVTFDIQGKSKITGIWKWVVSVVFSVMLIAVIYASVIIILSGEWLMQLLENNFEFIEISALWRWVRFVVLFLLLFTVIYSVYLVSAPKKTMRLSRLPGALVASIVLVTSSIFFSHIISVSLRYEILYGSLAAFIILMMWLYMCSIIVISANVFNIALGKVKEVKKTEKLSETNNDG